MVFKGELPKRDEVSHKGAQPRNQRALGISVPPRSLPAFRVYPCTLQYPDGPQKPEGKGVWEIQPIKFSFLGAKESGEGQGILLEDEGTLFSTYPQVTQSNSKMKGNIVINIALYFPVVFHDSEVILCNYMRGRRNIQSE